MGRKIVEMFMFTQVYLFWCMYKSNNGDLDDKIVKFKSPSIVNSIHINMK